MAVTISALLINFIISIIVSAIIIYAVAKIFGEKEGVGTAFITAFIGSVIYVLSYYFLGGIIASLIGGIAWLIALGSLYKMGWLKSLVVAIVIWVIASFVGNYLPTLIGPL